MSKPMNLLNYDFKPIKTVAQAKAIRLKLKALKLKAKLIPKKAGNKMENSNGN